MTSSPGAILAGIIHAGPLCRSRKAAVLASLSRQAEKGSVAFGGVEAARNEYLVVSTYL